MSRFLVALRATKLFVGQTDPNTKTAKASKCECQTDEITKWQCPICYEAPTLKKCKNVKHANMSFFFTAYFCADFRLFAQEYWIVPFFHNNLNYIFVVIHQ